MLMGKRCLEEHWTLSIHNLILQGNIRRQTECQTHLCYPPIIGGAGIRPVERLNTGSRRAPDGGRGPDGGGPGIYTPRGGGVGLEMRRPSSLEIHSSAASAIRLRKASKRWRL